MTLKNIAGTFLLYCGVAPFCGWLGYVALIGGV
jgi:hypothetical protein